MRSFDPAPAARERPARLDSPFAQGEPHPLARRAAEALTEALAAREVSGAIDFHAPGGGKMFGVLVAEDPAGQVGYLAAFSGMLGGRWLLEGFAPPLFDVAAREAFGPAAEAELVALEAELRALEGGDAEGSFAALSARHAAKREALNAQHRARRASRREARQAITANGAEAERLHALEEESRADKRERRRLEAAHAEAEAPLRAAVEVVRGRRAQLREVLAERSRGHLARLLAGYEIPNGRGERRSLLALYGSEAPPGGAGDCAAPKLLGQALRLGLRPLALAELWWGAPPLGGGRRSGVYYPACRSKCGVVLPFMLQGIDHAPAPLFGRGELSEDALRTVYEDRWLVVVDKPPGLLSVPGKGAALADSVLTRLRARYPEASGPLLVHRLDLDTSGLMVAAKDMATYVALQRRFAERAIEKRYVAWLEGEVRGEAGVIELALRVDLEDRPRQIHDPVHGRPAVTEWRVLTRAGGRTRVALWPRTGRTHQLRVHAAHPAGLGAPIVGDPLYGAPAERMMLHAEALAFLHPGTGRRLELLAPAPF